MIKFFLEGRLLSEAATPRIEIIDHGALSLIKREVEGGLELFVIVDPAAIYRNVTDRIDYSVLADHAYDWVSLHIDYAKQRVILGCSSHGCVPIYFSTTGKCIAITWDPIDILERTKNITLNLPRTAIFLDIFASPYSSQTLVEEIQRLPAGYFAIFELEKKGVRTNFFNKNRAQKAKTSDYLKPDKADLEIERLIEKYITPWTENHHLSISANLSGGLDSGVVCAIASRLLNKNNSILNTSGIIVTGKTREAQVVRRMEYIRRLSVNDHPVLAEEYSLFDFADKDWNNTDIIPWIDGYRKMFMASIKRIPDEKNRVLFTGYGGDELFYPQWSEMTLKERYLQESKHISDLGENSLLLSPTIPVLSRSSYFKVPRAITGVISPSAVEDSGAQAIDCLRNRILPVSPLCDRSLVTYCNSLHRNMKSDKAPFRIILDRFGFSSAITNSKTPENFTDYMRSSMECLPQSSLEDLLHEGELMRHGFLRRQSRSRIKTSIKNTIKRRPAQLLAILILEKFLQSYKSKIRVGKPAIVDI